MANFQSRELKLVTQRCYLQRIIQIFFRGQFPVFVLGAAAAGIGWIGMYVGVSCFFGAEIAKRIGSAGAKAVLGTRRSGCIEAGAAQIPKMLVRVRFRHPLHS